MEDDATIRVVIVFGGSLFVTASLTGLIYSTTIDLSVFLPHIFAINTSLSNEVGGKALIRCNEGDTKTMTAISGSDMNAMREGKVRRRRRTQNMGQY